MILVSSIGLAVNLMGLFFFHDHRHIVPEDYEPKEHNHVVDEHKHSHDEHMNTHDHLIIDDCE